MKKIALFLISLLFIFSGIRAQQTEKPVTKPSKLSKKQIEIIHSDGYAYAEAACRYDLSKLKLARDKDNQTLLLDADNNKLLLYEVMERALEKYSELTLNQVYMAAFNIGKAKLNTCIRVDKLKAQNELEKNPKK